MASRDELISRSNELGCFPDPENRTDQQLADAIAAEEAATKWLNQLDRLPTDAMKRDAVRRLRLEMERNQ